MCKIVSFTNSSKLDIKKASEEIGNQLLALERDGFGYAVQGSQNVFGEKSIAPNFKSRIGSLHLVKLPVVERRAETFGYVDKPVGPAIFHGRTSTNDKGLVNCHPMQRDNWHLIHNGVVDDTGPKYKQFTTNDSEHVLARLVNGIAEVEKYLTGYYAFAAIGPDGRLHVGRDNVASLFMAWCPKIQSFIFATTESLIESVCSELKIKFGPIDKVEPNIYMIFSGNELVHKQSIAPRGFERKQADFAEKSLGRVLEFGYAGHHYAVPAKNNFAESIIDAIETGEKDDEWFKIITELDEIDDSYTIYNYNYERITASEFGKMNTTQQSECTIERPDGSYLIVPDELWERM